jgi:catechol 2,3-dioxygenase-like lactoylglutathione lyase family enzyme
MSDRGLTHIALTVRDAEQSIAFYREFGGFEVVHERHDDRSGSVVVWLSDLTRPFVVVLIQNGEPVTPLAGTNHLGVGLHSRADVDAMAERARAGGVLELGPTDSGHPVGYWAIIRDPDGHQLEVSHGQHVGLTVDHARATS